MNHQTDSFYRPQDTFDLLRLPLVRRVARMRYGRLVFQVPLLLVALLLVYDGFTGPDRAAENLATVVPWVHYRGVIVLVLLLAGNLFCMSCPFTIPRTLAKRLSLHGRRFPRVLRNKWLAIASLLLLFFLYEYLDLWASPALTAWLIVAYFVASFVLEAVFTESAFCKYVCPIGTFNFVFATTAPTQITTRSSEICRSCVGKECINGSYSTEQVIRFDEIPVADGTETRQVIHGPKGTPGCGTELFVPQIKSNMDCLLCLDCVRACPHDNVGLMVRTPGRELLRSGSWPRRWDVSLMVIGLAFMGLVNAFGMVPPVYDLMQSMADTLGLTAAGLPDELIELIVLALIFLIGAVLLPLALTLLAAAITRHLTYKQQESQRNTVAAFAPAFVPLGLGIWIAHYGFHFLIGALTIIPVMQTFLIDHRITLLGSTPDWSLGGIDDVGLIGLIQVAALMGGFLWSMIIAQRTAVRRYGRYAVPGLLPWALLLLGLVMAAVWVFSQPMEMRGTILFS